MNGEVESPPIVGGVVQAPASVDIELMRARAYLSRVAEAPAPALVRLIGEVGAVDAAGRVRSGRVPERVAAETGTRRTIDRAEVDLDVAAATGARLLVPEDADWPSWRFTAFASCDRRELAAPLALWVHGPGRLAELCDRAVAVVGARAATTYGAHMACELATGLADRDVTVVSGAAIGIDGAAHRGALAVDGATIAVLACGIDRVYPAVHERLIERIAATGLVVSEYPPGCVPARHRFLVRNRLIAGMAAGTLVVEAGLRSGAQRTAADAQELGRVVMALPGPVTSGRSAGCHRLIRDGALLVTRAEEVLEGVGRIGDDLATDLDGGRARPTDDLDPIGIRVHDAFPARAARETRWLSMEAGVPIGAVRAALVDLERRGLVEHRGGRWQRAVRRTESS
jgi:DNA processing protein